MQFSRNNKRFEKKDQLAKDLSQKGGFMEFGAMGTMIFYLLMIGAMGYIIFALMSGSKLSEAEQSLTTLRLNVKHLYSSAPDYSDLSNTVIQNNGIVPQPINKSNGIMNGWNGAITVTTGTDPNTFHIQYANVPREACAKLASSQTSSDRKSVV